MKRISLTAFFLATALMMAGLGYQSISERIDDWRYPPPGQLVDIGGYSLHINCSGEGGPAVILEPGLGWTSLEWTIVQRGVEKFTQVCSYDRAGYGWSDPGPEPRTSQSLVDELHKLLVKAQVMPPYILVGHSFGVINVRLYASQYPEEVLPMGEA